MVSVKDKGKHLKDLILWELKQMNFNGEDIIELRPKEKIVEGKRYIEYEELYELTREYRIREGFEIDLGNGFAYYNKLEKKEGGTELIWVVSIDNSFLDILRSREGRLHERITQLKYTVRSDRDTFEKTTYHLSDEDSEE